MNYIIILVIIVIVLWKGKSYIRGFIEKIKDKKKHNIKTVSKEFVYTPVISSRTFYFAIEIEELGDGLANISVVKTKDLQKN